MSRAQRIDEVVELLERFVLGETNLSKRQVKVALALLEALPDASLPDDGDADDQAVLTFH